MILSLCALTALAALAPQPPRSISQRRPVIMGYYASWTDLKPEQIPFARYTYIAHAFITADAAGRIGTEGNMPSRTLTELAHRHHVKVLLSVGGEGSGPWLGAIASNPGVKGRFVGRVLQIARDYDYDGVDLDWEYPEHKTAEFTAMIHALRAGLGRTGLLTIAVPCSSYYGQWFDGPAIQKDIDMVQIMTYDLTGWPGSRAGPNSPLHPSSLDMADGNALSFDRFVGLWRQKGFPASKLLVGISCGGYRMATGAWGQVLKAPGAYREVTYADVLRLLKSGWRRYWDPGAQVPYLRSPLGSKSELVTYEDPQSVKAKASWAKAAGLKGLFFWELSQDYLPAASGKPDNLLVRAAEEAWPLHL